MSNATLYCFKAGGKYYTEERFTVAEDLFRGGKTPEKRRNEILASNNGRCPGLISQGDEFVWVVIPDDEVNGWPLMFLPRGGQP